MSIHLHSWRRGSKTVINKGKLPHPLPHFCEPIDAFDDKDVKRILGHPLHPVFCKFAYRVFVKVYIISLSKSHPVNMTVLYNLVLIYKTQTFPR